MHIHGYRTLYCTLLLVNVPWCTVCQLIMLKTAHMFWVFKPQIIFRQQYGHHIHTWPKPLDAAESITEWSRTDKYGRYNCNLRLNPFGPKVAKSGHFSILLCLTPDDFTCQGRSSESYLFNKLIHTKVTHLHNQGYAFTLTNNYLFIYLFIYLIILIHGHHIAGCAMSHTHGAYVTGHVSWKACLCNWSMHIKCM